MDDLRRDRSEKEAAHTPEATGTHNDLINTYLACDMIYGFCNGPVLRSLLMADTAFATSSNGPSECLSCALCRVFSLVSGSCIDI